MLSRRTWPDREQPVTTRPTARPPEKFDEIPRWALALALRPGGSRNRNSSSCNRADAASRLRRCQRQPLLTPAFAITPTLRPPPLFALRLRPIAPAGIPAPPTPRRLLASFTAIAILGLARMERLFTVFQKTAPLSKRPRPLIGRALGWILRWAHGRSYSRRSSLGGERLLFTEAFSSTHQHPPA
jgi:hypothetical protein